MPDAVANRYQLDLEVAEGPLSTLHRGTVRGDHGFSRVVAIRDLHRPLAGDRRFVGTWAATAAELAETPSPHVEQVFDVVAQDGHVYVISEWIAGVSLRRWIAAHAEPVPWPLAVEVAIEALRGLVDAHARTPALCHDGLCSAAVRIARDGTVKLTRFGAATALATTGMGRRRLEELGLRHPAPELVTGGDAGPSTDQLGVGALLYEMLAGAPPYPPEPGPERDAQVTGEPPDLATARPDVPPLLVALVERALSPEPEARFGSVTEMAQALARLLRSHPEPTGPEVLAASLQGLERDAAAAEAPAFAAPIEVDDETPGGPAALAASVRGLLRDAGKAPQGLGGEVAQQRTMHVTADELEEIRERLESSPAPVA
ncbi:MAG TPA: protein kinase, partial [Sandaracinaceae bacterium LLY-WYZ-13_1]|nr:protein kinase [Sandaracinaceae bacterium LLY-WYZ-13_1]